LNNLFDAINLKSASYFSKALRTAVTVKKSSAAKRHRYPLNVHTIPTYIHNKTPSEDTGS